MKKERVLNIEVLRILAMLFILLHHYAIHTDLIYSDVEGINKIISIFFSVFGKVGVNIFVLITGYFMINSKFKVKKIIEIELQVLFYSFSILLINVFLNRINAEIIINSVLPTTFSLYWFVSTYIILYIFTPFINKFIFSLKKENLEICLFFMFIIFSILSMVSENYYSNLFWFVYMYMIGAYIKIYNVKLNKDFKLIILIFFAFYVMYVYSKFYLIEDKLELKIKIYKLINMNSFPIFLIAIMIFECFKEKNITKGKKIINIFSKASFGVYLFHDNPYIREILWERLLHTSSYFNVNVVYFLFHIIFSITTIYLVGTVIELIRINCIEKYIFKNENMDNYFEKIDNLINVEI